MFIKVGFNRIFLLGLSIILLVIRLGIDIVIYFYDIIPTDVIIVWKLLTWLAIFGTLFLYLFSVSPNDKKEIGDEASPEKFFSHFFYLIIFGLIAVISDFLLPSSLSNSARPDSVIVYISIEIIAAYNLFTALLILRFIYKWLNLRKHKTTRQYIKVLVYGLVYLFLVELLPSIIPVLNMTFVGLARSFVLVFLFIAIFLTVKKNTWIAVLPRSQKMKLFWLTFFGIVVSIIISSLGIEETSKMHHSMTMLMSGSSWIVTTAYLYFSAFCLRLFFATIASLPTSQIVERRTSELSSLAYLNRVIAETIDFNNLIDTVTKLALGSSGGSAAWTEMYDKNGKVKVSSTQIVTIQQVEKVHEMPSIRERLKGLTAPLLVPSIPEDKELFGLHHALPAGKSLIAVPLFAGDERIGTLVVVNTEEYGFEHDDVKVLSAFADNVNIAIENARLLKDSIEKDRYRRELQLARQIQNKLLPQVIPTVENYSISAFSIPAEEVGGDYYDIVNLNDGKTCILIGDVSGKGISAAFIMAQLKGVVMSLAPIAKSPADLLRRINGTLYGKMERQMYITMTALEINEDSGKVSFARAGHMPVLVKSNNVVTMIIPKGMGIGLADSHIFDNTLEEVEITLSQGDACLLFTDGINELKNKNNEEYGYKPLSELMDGKSHNADYITGSLREAVMNFPDGAQQHDDITVVALVRNGFENHNILN